MRESWVDPTTGLMWAGKDNGQSVTWKNAVKYCRDLRLGGYSDWRLATIDELQSLVVKNTPASERSGSTETLHLNVGRQVRGRPGTDRRSLEQRPGQQPFRAPLRRWILF